MKQSKKTGSFKRTLHYFWEALMQNKIRTCLILFLVPIWIFISNVVVPYGTSEIVGKLSSGDFEIADYTGILLFTLLSAGINNLGILRIIDWLDWSLDAKGGEYLSKLCFNAVINQSMTFHNDKFSGSLTSAANKLPNAFIGFKSGFVWDMFPLLLNMAYAIIVTGIICLPFALILFAYAALYITIAAVTYCKTRNVDEKLANTENKRTGQLADSITNMVSVKSYARERFENERFTKATKKVSDATFGMAKVSFWRNLSMNLVNIVTSAGILVLIIMSHNLFGLSIASIVFLYSLSSTLLSNIWNVNHILRNINRTFGDAKEMVEILDMERIVDDKTDKPLKVTDAEIDFDHMTFRHKNKENDLFSNFDFKIPGGVSIGLVGMSGSGKSTLAKLLLRFADVDEGGIYIDGQDIRDVTQKSLREAIAYVPQESSLFHRTIFENISYGRLDATDEEVYEAARLAHADEFIEKLPDGYDTMVGERGVKLSGGQRQRIAIARAILKDAPILVLDEATSALDSESEALIQKALTNLMEGRTSIVVAHRLSTIASLDKIVVLHDGEIIEQGTHKELLAKNGEYAKLWSRQSGAFLDES